MRKLEEITAAEEQRIEKAEKDLEEDAVGFLEGEESREMSGFIFSICLINFLLRIIRMLMKLLDCKLICLSA